MRPGPIDGNRAMDTGVGTYTASTRAQMQRQAGSGIDPQPSREGVNRRYGIRERALSHGIAG